MRLSHDQSAARSVGRNSERFRHRTSEATAFGGTALRSIALRASVRRVFPVFACAMMAFSTDAITPDAETDAPTSPYLQSVRIVGYWKDGPRDGLVRIAISGGGTEHFKNRVWLQWIEQKHDDRVHDVLASTRELREFSGISIVSPIGVNPKFASNVTFEGTHAYDRCTFRARVNWTVPGAYSVKFLQSASSKSDCTIDRNRLSGRQ